MSENETGIVACDLAPPMPLIPNPSGPGVRPKYVPGPQPEGTVRVVLDGESYGEPPSFCLYETFAVIPQPYAVFDIPREQYERWEAAMAARLAMEEEIEALIEARQRAGRR